MKRWPAIIALAVMAATATALAAAETGGRSWTFEWADAKSLDGYVLEFDGRYVSVMPTADATPPGKVRVELMSFWRFPEGMIERSTGGVPVAALSQLTEIDCRSFDYVTITNINYAPDGRRSVDSPVNMGGPAGSLMPVLKKACDGSYRTDAKFRFTTIAEFLAIRDEVAKSAPPKPKGTWRIVPPEK